MLFVLFVFIFSEIDMGAHFVYAADSGIVASVF